MNERRWPWLAAGSSIVAAGLVSGVATYLRSMPCARAVVPGEAGAVSDRCIEILSGEVPPPDHPLATTFASTALLLVALGWLAAVLGSDWRRRSRLIATPLAVLILAQAALLFVPGVGDGSVVALKLATDVASAMALLTVLTWTARGRLVTLGVLAVCATTTTGLIAVVIDYLVMFSWTDSYWEDNPPGTGYLLAAVLVSVGLVMLILSRGVGDRSPHPPAGRSVTAAVAGG